MSGTREELELICKMMGKALHDEISNKSTGKPFGFLLLMFDFGPDGFCAHVSNARREDMIKLLREHLAKLEQETN